MVVRITNVYTVDNRVGVECEVTQIVLGTVNSYVIPTVYVPKVFLADEQAFIDALKQEVEHIIDRQNDHTRFIGLELKI